MLRLPLADPSEFPECFTLSDGNSPYPLILTPREKAEQVRKQSAPTDTVQYSLSSLRNLREIQTDTVLKFYPCKSKIVLLLDTSPSMASLDPVSETLLFSELISSLSNCLVALLKRMHFPYPPSQNAEEGSGEEERSGGEEEVEKMLSGEASRFRKKFKVKRDDREGKKDREGCPIFLYEPCIHVTVLTFSSVREGVQLLMKGRVLTRASVHDIIHTVKHHIDIVRDTVANALSGLQHPSTSSPSSSRASSTASSPRTSPPTVSPRLHSTPSPLTGDMDTDRARPYGASSLEPALQGALQALDELPEDACPSILLLTGGMVQVPDTHMYDSVGMTLSRADVPCSAVLVGGGYRPYSPFGYVPETDELQSFCSKTSGQLFGAREVSEMANTPSRLAGEMRKGMFKQTCFRLFASVPF